MQWQGSAESGVLRAVQLIALWKSASLSSGLKLACAIVSSKVLLVQSGHTMTEVIFVVGPANGMGSRKLSSLACTNWGLEAAAHVSLQAPGARHEGM